MAVDGSNSVPVAGSSEPSQGTEPDVHGGVAQSPAPCLMSLPSEIISDIVDYAAITKSSESSESDVSVVKALRLTCKRLRDLSSSLLVRRVKISLNPDSLARLDAISNSPAIAAGVKRAHVALAYFPKHLADSLPEFIKFQRDCLDRRRERLAAYAQFDSGPSNLEELLDLHIDELRAVGFSGPLKPKYRTLMGNAHEEFKKRQKAQEEACGKGYDHLAKTIATCLARMPNLWGLEFSDEDFNHLWTEDYKGNDVGLYNHMVSPIRWEKIKSRRGQEPPPLELVIALPTALGKAGVRLELFSMVLTSCDHQCYAVLQPSKAAAKELNKFGSSLRQVQVALNDVITDMKSYVHPPQLMINNENKGESTRVAAFLNAMFADMDDLETLVLGASSFKRYNMLELMEPRFWPALTTLLNVKPWPKLRILDLHDVVIGSARLRELLGDRQATLKVRLKCLCLLQGDWHDTVDMLRNVSNPAREGAAPVFVECFVYPNGPQWYMLDDTKRRRIFGDENNVEGYLNDDYSPTLSYIRWKSLENPVPAGTGAVQSVQADHDAEDGDDQDPGNEDDWVTDDSADDDMDPAQRRFVQALLEQMAEGLEGHAQALYEERLRENMGPGHDSEDMDYGMDAMAE
ncbi:hypothetical protein CkaCkLH20_10765 [Colletotrichum karsti]|uniref:F-box domain-containing protein n=1 Tax=Colletotrichum karsti TaxID=1095194 RepID=A0A9P6LG53_9PEZI|nr:uncharacterized protein CkaCkLH20_10765 [Colletotrichum karsti]KAF9871831.1 hypothetical protein CkaCkLH20_10765 [Colletotrichum karsti]